MEVPCPTEDQFWGFKLGSGSSPTRDFVMLRLSFLIYKMIGLDEIIS